jgi:hypothetical protein
LIGLVSMVGLIVFDVTTRAKLAAEPYLLVVLTGLTAFYTYGWKPALFFVVAMVAYIVLERFAPHTLPTGQTET